jgi:hypothetical protein
MFSFHSDLFGHRAKAMEVLAENGFDWLSHYSAVDLLHAEYGLEVAGIREEEDGKAMLKILQATFPEWRQVRFYYSEYVRDRGWKIEIYKLAEDGDQKTT